MKPSRTMAARRPSAGDCGRSSSGEIVTSFCARRIGAAMRAGSAGMAIVVLACRGAHNPARPFASNKILIHLRNISTPKMIPPTLNEPVALPAMHEVSLQQYPDSALYVLATPIGNLGDITLRALHVLSLADAVACEDTRNTAHLLMRYGLSKPLIAAHQHNEREIADKLIARLRAGERIALVSAAGTPAISDPGARIVDAVAAAGLRVVPIPGGAAAGGARAASGLMQDRFYFIGFLPAKAGQRDAVLQSLRAVEATLVFY